MNIYRYSLKSFRQNISKGIIFMIALAVTLMSTVLNIGTSVQETIYQENVAVNSDSHAKYINITEEQARFIALDDSLQWSSLRLGLRRSWGLIPGQDTGIGLYYLENLETLEGFGQLDSGKAPEAENEVALPPHTAKALGLEPKPGEAFTLTVQSLDSTTVQYDLVISGICSEMKYNEAFEIHMIYFSRAFMDAHGSFPAEYGAEAAESLDAREMFVHFKNGSSVEAIKDQAQNLAALAGIDENDIRYNEDYNSMSLYSPDALSFLAIILLILLATGAIVIYNAFNMVIIKRVRQLGMLILIGASKRQVRACVYLEALLSLAVALPLGLLLGMGLSYCSLPLLSQSMGGLDLYFNVNPWSYLLVTALALVMVWIGVSRPAKRAAKITPVEAVKLSPASEKARRRKERQNVTVPALAKLNMGRNRSRTVSTILTLTISGILLLSLSTVGLSMYEGIDGMLEGRFAGDIRIQTGFVQGNDYYNTDQDPLTDDVLQSIGQIDGVENVSAFYGQVYCTEFKKHANELVATGNVLGIDRNMMSGLLDSVIDGSPTMEELSDTSVYNVIAVNQYAVPITKPYLLETGATVTAYAGDLAVSENAVKLHVVGIISDQDIPVFANHIGGNLPDLLMLQDVYSETGFVQSYISAAVTIDEEKYDSIVAALQNVTESYEEIYYESMADQKAEYRRQIAGVLALVLLAVFIIVLIGMLNLSSSVLIGIEQRKQEFGVLSALGLDRKGLRRLLSYESIRISAVSILFSAVLGLGFGYILYYLLYQAGMDFLALTFPFVPLVVMCAVYISVPLLVTSVAVRRLRRSTTIELLGDF